MPRIRRQYQSIKRIACLSMAIPNTELFSSLSVVFEPLFRMLSKDFRWLPVRSMQICITCVVCVVDYADTRKWKVSSSFQILFAEITDLKKLTGMEFDCIAFQLQSKYVLTPLTPKSWFTVRVRRLDCSLPDFKPWRSRYESVNYGIRNYWFT